MIKITKKQFRKATNIFDENKDVDENKIINIILYNKKITYKKKRYFLFFETENKYTIYDYSKYLTYKSKNLDVIYNADNELFVFIGKKGLKKTKLSVSREFITHEEIEAFEMVISLLNNI